MAAVSGKRWSDIQDSPHESGQKRETTERVPPNQESEVVAGEGIGKSSGGHRFLETEDHVQVRKGWHVQGAAAETPEMRVQALPLSQVIKVNFSKDYEMTSSQKAHRRQTF